MDRIRLEISTKYILHKLSTAKRLKFPCTEHLEKVAAHHDEESETYDADYFQRFRLYHEVTLDNIRRFLPKTKDKTILDAGGGTGIWSVEVARMGYRVVLTDISQGMLKQAERKIAELKLRDRIETMVLDICNMPDFEDGQFAMVLCEGDPLSYCGNHRAAIKELVRVLEPGGALVASVDNRVSAMGWLRDEVDPDVVQRLLETGEVVRPQKQEGSFYVIHAFTPDELRSLWVSNGLSVERIIGKLAIANRLACFRSEDHEIQQWLLMLELKYNDNPAFYSCSGHLEIVGRKPVPEHSKLV